MLYFHSVEEFFFFFFCQEACRILVPPPGLKPVPPAVEAQNLNHWTAREVLQLGVCVCVCVCVRLCNAPNTQYAGGNDWAPPRARCEVVALHVAQEEKLSGAPLRGH